jgi:hypothetical protein
VIVKLCNCALAFALLIATGPARAQWQIENSTTTADLRGIDSVGGGIAWASGTNGTVLRTEDGGYLWQPCAIPPGAEHLDFRGIQAFDASTAIVMSSGTGDLSRLYKTTDGCQTWKLVFTNPDKDGFWDAVRFNEGNGIVLGDPVKGSFVIFASSDAGKTWTRQTNKGLRANSVSQGAFAASNSALIGAGGSTCFATGGTGGAFVRCITRFQICLDDCSESEVDVEGRHSEWSTEEAPIGNHSQTSGIFSIAEDLEKPRSGSMVVVGGDYSKPDDIESNSAFSEGGDDHWLPAQTPPHGFRSAVAWDAASKTWITVGPNGTDVSTDDGKNWRAVHPDPALHETGDADRNWNALSLPFVVGPHGRIGKLDPQALKP